MAERVHGKDEVVGSNPILGSIKTVQCTEFRVRSKTNPENDLVGSLRGAAPQAFSAWRARGGAGSDSDR